MLEFKYKVPVKIVFEGFAIVRAVNETVAEDIAANGLTATLGDACSDDLKIIDFSIEKHGTIETQK